MSKGFEFCFRGWSFVKGLDFVPVFGALLQGLEFCLRFLSCAPGVGVLSKGLDFVPGFGALLQGLEFYSRGWSSCALNFW